MRHLDKIIEDYLSKETDYAVQLDGGWGHGKTYYYRHEIENQIASTKVHSNASKNYKPVYISLFGLKTVEDIHTKMVVDFFSSKVFKSYRTSSRTKKRLKISESLFKIGMRGFLGFKQLGDINEYLADVRDIGANVLDAKELVICFDDLERRDSALQLPDLIGYINSLVDEGIKVMIIANEDRLKNQADGTYEQLKEKVIGITVAYVPDVAATLQNIIDSRFGGFAVYQTFLSGHAQRLEQLALAAGCNFRHIKYGLDCLHKVYSHIKNQVLDPGHMIKEKVAAELDHILVSTMALAIEYKASQLSHKDLEKFRGDALFSMWEDQRNEQTPVAQGADLDGAGLRKKYQIADASYHIYPSIFLYVTMAADFEVEAFIRQVQERFMMVDGVVPPHMQLLVDLDYRRCYNWDDETYREKTQAMLDYAYRGQYPLSVYLTVMQFVERFDNWLGLDLAQVRQGLLAALPKVLASMGPDHPEISRFEMVGSRYTVLADYTKFADKALELINAHRQEHQRAANSELAGELLADPETFLLKYFEDRPFQTRIDALAILQYLEPAELANSLQASSGETLVFMQKFFRDRYVDNHMLSLELSQLKELRDQMMVFALAKKAAGPHMLALIATEFSSTLDEICVRGQRLAAANPVNAANGAPLS